MGRRHEGAGHGGPDGGDACTYVYIYIYIIHRYIDTYITVQYNALQYLTLAYHTLPTLHTHYIRTLRACGEVHHGHGRDL